MEGEHHVTMKAKMGVMLLQAKDQQSLPGNHQKPGERPGMVPSQPLEGTYLPDTLISDLQPPELRQHRFAVSTLSL